MLIQFLMAHLKPIKNDKGQSMVEYVLLITLISVAAITTILLLGPQLIVLFNKILTALISIATAP